MAPQQGIFSDYGHEQCRAWRDDTATALQVSTEPVQQHCLIGLYGNHYVHELFSACKECATTPLEVPKITASALQHWIFSDYGSYKGHALCRHWREHTAGCRSMKFRLRLRVSNADYLACKAGIMSMNYWVPGGKIRLFARLLTTLLSYLSSTHSNLHLVILISSYSTIYLSCIIDIYVFLCIIMQNRHYSIITSPWTRVISFYFYILTA